MKLVLAFFSTLFCLMSSAYSQQQWKKVTQDLIMTDPPFKQCHASTIVEPEPGQLLAAWFAGSREGANDVCIWICRWEKGKWNKPLIIISGIVNDTLRYPCWNPVLFKSKSGKLFLFYKVGPSPQTWWGMVMTSGDNGKKWSQPQRMPDGILGPIKNKPVQLDDGSILSGSSTETKESWRVHMELSDDDGLTWTKIAVDTLSAFDVIQPTLTRYDDRRIQILCRSRQGVIVQSWSADHGKTWSKLSKTELMNPNSGIDAVTLADGRQLLVYNPDLPGKEWFNGRAKLHVAISIDGYHWKDVAVLENGTKEEFSYPAAIQASDGSVHITYTYDRKNIKHVVLRSL